MQTVRSFVERLTFDGDRIGEGDCGILIRSRAPYLAVGYELAPDLAAIDQRPVIVDGDIGEADALGDHGMLALQREIEHYSLAGAKTCHRQETT